VRERDELSWAVSFLAMGRFDALVTVDRSHFARSIELEIGATNYCAPLDPLRRHELREVFGTVD
jgi:hypothetical protein